MTCRHVGGAIVCGPGEYTHLVRASCPWCCVSRGETTRHAFREVFGGWCAPDMVCGECGQKWTAGDDRLRKPDNDTREDNIALVQALADAGVVEGPFPRPTALDDEATA